MDNNKPTTEELDAGIKSAIEAGDTPDPVEESTTDPQEATEEEYAETIIEEVSVEEPTTETPEEVGEPSVVDYKKKFTESSREAQIIQSKLKKTNEAIEQAASITDIPEDELQAEYHDWDIMSDTEKRLAKDSLLSKKRFELIHQSSLEGKDIEVWNQKVDTYIEDPKILIANPDLEGKTEDFKVFATKQTRRGADFETLVSAFLFEVEKARPKHTGKMFETGVGGPNESPKPRTEKISLEEASTLRDTNYNKYKEYLKAGKIADQ